MCRTLRLPAHPATLFELLVAARFHLADDTIDFDDTSDVVAKRDGLVVRAECKRLVSGKQLEKRINYATDQLAKAMAKTDEEALGIVFIDVSSCMTSVRLVVMNGDSSTVEEMTRSKTSSWKRRTGIKELTYSTPSSADYLAEICATKENCRKRLH